MNWFYITVGIIGIFLLFITIVIILNFFQNETALKIVIIIGMVVSTLINGSGSGGGGGGGNGGGGNGGGCGGNGGGC